VALRSEMIGAGTTTASVALARSEISISSEALQSVYDSLMIPR
jgi:hypothetical protein